MTASHQRPYVVSLAMMAWLSLGLAACGKAAFRDIAQNPDTNRNDTTDGANRGKSEDIKSPASGSMSQGEDMPPPIQSKDPLMPKDDPGAPRPVGNNTGGTPAGSPSGTMGGNPGGSMGGNPGGSMGGNPGGTMGGNPGGTMGGNPGGTMGGNPGGTMGGNPGGTMGGNPGGTMGGNPGGTMGGNPGGSTGGTPGGGGKTPDNSPVVQAETVAGGVDGTLLICLNFRQGVMSVHNLGKERWFAANFYFTVKTSAGPVARRWNPAMNTGYQLPGDWSKVCNAAPVVTKFRPLQTAGRRNPPLWSLPPRMNQGDQRCVYVDDGDNGRPGAVEMSLDWRLTTCQ